MGIPKFTLSYHGIHELNRKTQFENGLKTKHYIILMAKSHDMSLCEIDNMIRIYSDKIFQLQEQRAKLIGSIRSTHWELLKNPVKQHMTNYKSK